MQFDQASSGKSSRSVFRLQCASGRLQFGRHPSMGIGARHRNKMRTRRACVRRHQELFVYRCFALKDSWNFRNHPDTDPRLFQNFPQGKKKQKKPSSKRNPLRLAAGRNILLLALIAGWSSLVARQAHNLKAVGSNPTPATNLKVTKTPANSGGFCLDRFEAQFFDRSLGAQRIR